MVSWKSLLCWTNWQLKVLMMFLWFRVNMDTKNKFGRDLILRRIAQAMYLNKLEMRRIMAQMSIMKILLRKRCVLHLFFTLAVSYVYLECLKSYPHGCCPSLSLMQNTVFGATKWFSINLATFVFVAYLSLQDGDHLSKDKGGQRYRNQGRSRKHKYRAVNGMGIFYLYSWLLQLIILLLLFLFWIRPLQ